MPPSVLVLAGLLVVGGAFADDKKDDNKSDPPPSNGRAGRGGGFGGGAGVFGGQLVPTSAMDQLKLSDSQKEQVSKLQKEFDAKVQEKSGKVREEMQKAFQNQDREAITKLQGQMREVRQDTQKIMEDYEGKVKALLNDDQKKTYETVLKDRPRGFGGFGGGFGGGNGGFGGGGFGGFARGGQGPRELTSPAVQTQLNLTDEQKAKLDKLKKEYEEASLKVLTDDQKKKYDEIKNAPPGGRGFGRGNGNGPGGNRPVLRAAIVAVVAATVRISKVEKLSLLAA